MKRSVPLRQTTLATWDVMSRFPKVELHRHLEGTFHIPTLFDIAKKNGIDSPDTLDAFYHTVQFPKDSPPDFLAFLSKFRNDWYRSHEDIRRITYDSLVKLGKEGIFYIEARFNPLHFTQQNDYDPKEVTKLIIETANQAAKDGGFFMNYLITFNRSKQNEHEMLDLYTQLKDLAIPEVVGIDLAGDEINYPPEQFKTFFAKVFQDNLYGITVHAGEVSPSSQIWTAINDLHATRIGHGTATINDPALQERLRADGITLEQCITSNFQTGSWTDSPRHPLGELFRSQVPVTINTDDPHIQDCDLTDEYLKVAAYFDFSLDDFVKINHVALEGSFVNAQRKAELHRLYDEKVEYFCKDMGVS